MIRILDANKGEGEVDRREALNDTHGQVSAEYFDRNLEPFRTLEMHVISTGRGERGGRDESRTEFYRSVDEIGTRAAATTRL